MKNESKKPMKWWMWILALAALPITLTIWVWRKKDWSQSKRLKVIAGMWVVFLIIGAVNGSFSNPPVQVSTGSNTNTATSQPTKDEKKDENAVINQELHDERKSYDTNRGSNAEAARTAQALIDLAQAASPGTDFDAFIRLEAPDKASKKYELGGDSQEYKNEVSFVGLTIVIDSGVWSSANEDQKKNLIASWSKIMQNQYPNAGGWMKVTNGLRDVAEANWLTAKYGRSPEIKLK